MAARFKLSRHTALHGSGSGLVKSLLNVRVIALLVWFGLTACQNYAVSLNERSVYQPKQLLTQLSIADRALENCIHQHIKDQKIRSFEELTVLVCTHAGISELEGLNQFNRLEQLNLADNAIEDITGLTGLSRLTRLNLDNNALGDIQTLFTLPRLQQASLLGNAQVACRDISQLRQAARATITAPKHCHSE